MTADTDPSGTSTWSSRLGEACGIHWRWIAFSSILMIVFMGIAGFPSLRAMWLAHQLKSGSETTAQAAEESMIEAKGRAVFLQCQSIIQFGTGPVRRRAVRIMGELGYPQARSILQIIVDNDEEDEDIRILARSALVKIDLAVPPGSTP